MSFVKISLLAFRMRGTNALSLTRQTAAARLTDRSAVMTAGASRLTVSGPTSIAKAHGIQTQPIHEDS
jgi:hypothetical protein